MTNFPLVGICADPANAVAVRQAGADFLEVNVQTFLVPGGKEAEFAPHRELAAKLDLPIRAANCFLPASLPCVGPMVDEPALLAYAANTFDRAEAVGIRRVVFGSGGARNIPAGFPPERAREQVVDFLRKIAPLAERASVVVAVEPLNTAECNFIVTLAEGAGIVEDCGHPAVRLLADTYHMGFISEGPDAVRKFGHLLCHFHFADHPSRRYPGADGTSFREWFVALREIGYTGAVSVECRWGDLAQEIGPAVANVRRDLTEAGLGAA